MVSFVDIIFLTLIVVFLLVRLYSVFGTRSNNQKVHIILKPINSKADKAAVDEFARSINLNSESMPIIAEPIELTELDKKLLTIPDFNKNKFLNGARKVFEIVLQAFYNGDMEVAKGLVSNKVLTAFNQAIEYRKNNNITSEMDFICFEKSNIVDVKLLKNSVKIVVEFVSEQVNILKNAEGEVIEGDENFVQKITDKWTFERLINAKNNHWTLVSTKKSA